LETKGGGIQGTQKYASWRAKNGDGPDTAKRIEEREDLRETDIIGERVLGHGKKGRRESSNC